jgi:glycosyltransferase involved in cell wall biosynthesis
MGKPIRILHVAVNMNRGGAETFILNVYRNIDRSVVQFDFLTSKEGVYDQEIRAMGGIIHRIPYITDVGHFKYYNALFEFFSKNSEYRIVHTHMDKMSGLVLKAANKANIPIRISHSHSTKSEGNLLARIYKFYVGSYIAGNATHKIACSHKAAEWLYGSHPQNTLLVQNGIDLKAFSFSNDLKISIRKEFGISEDTFVLGHVGRFNHPKNHTFLIDVFNEVSNINKNSVLLLLGEGDLRGNIKQKVDNMGLTDKVFFLGIRDDVDRILNTFDVFLLPSLYEGFPVSLVEAQAVGVPCFVSTTVTKEVDIINELLTFVSLKNPKEWASKILTQYHKEQNSFNRIRESNNIMKEKGFDILKTAQDLQDFYLRL